MNIDYSLPCRETNYRKGRTDDIKYIVLHYTGNDGSTAWQNAHYFHESKVEASAHYFIDNDSIYASVPEGDTAWAVGVRYGDAPFWNKCKNSNSISIEMCTFGNEIQQPTVDKAVELTRALMNKYGIPIDRVVRHYDVCAKACPAQWIGQGEILWNLFKIIVNGAPVTEVPSAPEQQGGMDGNFVIACGQLSANNYVGHHAIEVDGIVGPNTRKMAVRVLQHSMNLDYNSGLEEDGIKGRLTNNALGNHYVKRGETQYMVTCMEILALLHGVDPKGVEYPGTYGGGLTEALGRDYCDSAFINSYSNL